METNEVVRQDEQTILQPFADWSRELDTAALPARIRTIIGHLCKVLQCPKEFVIISIYQAVGVAVGNASRIITPQGHENPPMLWAVIVAPSGTGKSAPLRRMLKPLFDIDREEFDKYELEAKQYRHQVSTRQRHKLDTSDLEAPRLRQMIIQDSTEEGRMRVLRENPGGILLYNDELDGFFGRMGRYTKNGGTDEITRLIDCWDNGTVKITRQNQEHTKPIEKAFLSIVGTIQPETLRRRFENPAYTETGFAQRWLFVWNDSYTFPDYSTERLDPAVTEDWRDFIRDMVKKIATERSLRLTDAAEQVYRDYYRYIRAKKTSSSGDAARSLYAKLEINVYRWALITQLIRDPLAATITKTSMQYAVQCMQYFEHTGQKVLQMIQETDGKEKKPETAGKMPKIGDLVKFIKERNSSLTNTDLASTFGVSRQAISQALKRTQEEADQVAKP